MTPKTVKLPCSIGDRVFIREIECFARVRNISLGVEGTQFELSWFINGDRKTGWFLAIEFESDGAAT